MAKKVEIEIDVNSNVEGSIKQLRELKKQLKETAVGSEEFKKIFNQIDDLEDKIKSAKNVSSDWIDTLASAPGPLGAVGRAINGVKVATISFGAAFKAIGIGLIVSAIAGIAAAFSSTEEAGKKLQPILIGFQKILGGIFRALQPVFDGLINVATKALPYVTEAFSVAYSAISSFLQGIGLLGSALYKFVTGDFKAAWEDASDAVAGFGDRYDKARKDFASGTQELTAIEKEELKKRQELEKAALEKRRQQQEEYRKQVEQDTKSANEKLLKLQNDFQVATAKNEFEAQRIKLQQEYEAEVKEINLLKLKNQRINGILITGEELRNRLLIQSKKNYLNATSKIDQDEVKAVNEKTTEIVKMTNDLRIKLAKLQDDNIKNDYVKRKEQRQLQFVEDTNDLNAQKEAIIEKYNQLMLLNSAKMKEYQAEVYKVENIFFDAVDALDAKMVQDIKNINKEEIRDIQKQAFDKLDAELKVLELRNQVLNEKTQEFFRNQSELLQKAYEKEKAIQEAAFRDRLEDVEGNAEKEKEIEKEKADVLLGIEKKYQADKKNLKQQEIAAYGEVASATINSFAAITGALAAGYDEEAKTSKKAFEQRKKLQVATALMSAASGVIQILTQPSTLPSPFDWIVKVANAAALGITTAIQISTIKKAKFEGAEGGGEAGPAGNQMGRGYADGGIVRGPGTSKSDSIPARLSNGEAVMTSGAVTMFAPMLSMMNQMGGGTSFSSNLNTTLPDNPNRANPSMEQQPLIMKTYIVENELTSTQQRQARLKDLSTL